MNGEELRAKYGEPVKLDDVVPGEVFAFLHNSQEAAQAFVDSNIENHGHPGWKEQREEGWVSVVDLRPRLREIERQYRENMQ